MGLKTFLAHRHCQSLRDLRWRGGYPDSAIVINSQHSAWQVFLWAFINPMGNPYLGANGSDGVGLAAKRRKTRGFFPDDEEDEKIPQIGWVTRRDLT